MTGGLEPIGQPNQLVSVITRRRMAEALNGFSLTGKTDLPDFLRKHLPDIWSDPPKVLNIGWDGNNISEEKLKLIGFFDCSQAKLFGFIEAVVNPSYREEDEQKAIVEKLDPLLRLDGFTLAESGRVSGCPIYRTQETAPAGTLPADELIPEALASFDEAGVREPPPPMNEVKVIVALHGIRTIASWQRTLSDAAQNLGWRCPLEIWNYGQFSLLRFLMPRKREMQIRWFRSTYNIFMRDKSLPLGDDNLPSIVAHSFGTYIIGYALLKYENIRFDKIILCASILPQEFPWDEILNRGQVTAVLNEYGSNDIWSKIVHWFIAGTGSSGHQGFSRRHPSLIQKKFLFDHSEYFDRGHMEANWLSFIAHTPTASTAPPISAPQMRVFVPQELTPKRLFSFYQDNTAIQAAELTKGYIGRWMKVTGGLGDVGAWTGDMLSVSFELSNVPVFERTPLDYTKIHMHFRDAQKSDRLKILKRGDRITVIGQLMEVNAYTLHLDNCELVDPNGGDGSTHPP